MHIGTKILLLMLLLTIGSAAIVSWVVTLNVTRYETNRAEDQISLAIGRYGRQLDDQYRQISRVVHALLGTPVAQSLLQAADDASDKADRAQLKEEIIGRDVQSELASPLARPAFVVLFNLAHEVIFASASGPDPAANARLEHILTADSIQWPVDAVIDGKSQPVMQYISTPAGLFLAMGIPLYDQLDQPPSHAYFVVVRIDDDWVRGQLLPDHGSADSTVVPLAAWFVVDGKVVAKASSDAARPALADPGPDASPQPQTRSSTTAPSVAKNVQFTLGPERFVGQSFDFDSQTADVRLILASSLDKALAPLHQLQRSILLTAIGACIVALVACRAIALMISRPIEELVKGTKRIAAGQFDAPVQIRRHDELGALAQSFNQMSQGLKQRDGLLEERVKTERDLAVARKIQMGVLPRDLPTCPGYDMAAFSLPAEQTGGDIYDLFTAATDPGAKDRPPSLVLLLADATGHGIGPALSVTQVRSMLRVGVRLGAPLNDILTQINRQLCQDLGSDRFVTAFLGLLNPLDHTIHYQSAGQGPLLHFHAADQTIQWLQSSMLPLGIDEDASSEDAQRLHIEPGDLFVLLTDGFYECQNAQRQLFGEDRVAQIVTTHHLRPTKDLLNELLAQTKQFADGHPQMDDMTALIIRRL